MGQCTKRSIWISIFLSVLVIAFTAHILAVLSPSWQYVYLEDGRTEHHHGLWLDCKRDYTNEYGRPREYYETLYRLDHLQGPFDQFWLPQLLCVYKFDFWLDDEDLYEHGYDENRLQGDAYQHLFLGWKIATLTAHVFTLVCTFKALIILFCGYCHRLLICVAAVLVTLAVISCSIGNVVFYMFANYQDNNIIKEEDGIYEQHFGWSFYASLIGNCLLLIASIIGCIATYSILSVGRTRLVKLENLSDSAKLLHMSHLNSAISSATADSNRFKRSSSAVYKIDSMALRKWERNAMRNVNNRDAFKRANSMPNIKKGTNNSCNSNNSIQSNFDTPKVLTDSYSHQFIPSMNCEPLITPIELGINPSQNHINNSNEEDLIYEYVDHNSLSLNSSKFKEETLKRQYSTTALNTYDKVPLDSDSGSRANLISNEISENEYLKPISVSSSRTGSINQKSNIPITTKSIPPKEIAQKITNTNKRTMFEYEFYERQKHDKITTTFNASYLPRTNVEPSFLNQKTKLSQHGPQKTYEPSAPPLTLKKPTIFNNGIPLNTFQQNGNRNNRSITNLVDIGSEQVSSISLFDDRHESADLGSLIQKHNSDKIETSKTDVVNSPAPFSHIDATYNFIRPKETNFDGISSCCSEMDRSMGSIATFMANSPSNFEKLNYRDLKNPPENIKNISRINHSSNGCKTTV